MTQRTILYAAVVVLVGIVLPDQPRAAPEADKQRARVLFKKANQLFQRGMYLDALEKYRRARALYPSFKIDLNIGATLDAMGRRTEAAIYFEKFLAQSSSAPAAIIQAAQKRLFELTKKLGSVKVTSIVDGATLEADGRVVGTIPVELPVYLEPGRHVLRLKQKGYLPLEKTLELAAGQHETLDLTPEKAAPPARLIPRAVAREAPDDRAAQRRRKTLWGYTALGVGAALSVTAAVLYGVGGSQGSEAYDRYRSSTDPQEIEGHYDDVESAKTKLVVGHVLMGAAAAAVGVSIYQFLTRPSAETRSTGRAPTVHAFSDGGGALVQLRGTF